MKNREISIAVCGTVLGIIIGSFSSSYAVPAQGDLTDVAYIPFHNAADASDYTRRKIDAKDIPVLNEDVRNDYPTVKSSSSAVGSAMALDMSPCAMVKRSIAKVRTVYDAVIPANIRNTDIHTRMNAAFKDALSECATPAAVSSSSSPVVAKKAVDNDCETYPVRSIRYTQCNVYEKNGWVFP